MPGVFTSRGCAACRKQKKGCVAEDEVPPCQRCKKLRIPCIGLGQRRFKFQDDSEKIIAIHGGKRVPSDKSQHLQDNEVSKNLIEGSRAISRRQYSQYYTFHAPPTSALSKLTAAYVRGIDPVADISVHLPWNFGPFLEDMPRLLGTSDSLDAAADAVVAGYGCLRMNRRAAEDQHSLRKYSAALKALSQALAEPTTATATETLCAIKMLMIFETISGSSTSVLSHAGGAARVFKARGFLGPKNELEAKLLLSLRGPVVIQSMFLTHSYFTEAEWAAITESNIGATSSEEQSFRCFALYARLLQKARALLAMQTAGDQVPQPAFAALAAETNNLREMHDVFLHELRERFWGLDGALQSSGETIVDSRSVISGTLFPSVSNGTKSGDWSTNVLHAHIGRSYGLSLGCQILLNALLVSLWDQLNTGHETVAMGEENLPTHLVQSEEQLNRRTLEIENAAMAREVCHFATSVSRHRPLGTVYMALVLRIAYVEAEKTDLGSLTNAAANNEQHSLDLGDLVIDIEPRIRQLFRIYTSDFEGSEAAKNESADNAADFKIAGELAWLRDLFKLRLREPTFVEKEG